MHISMKAGLLTLGVVGATIGGGWAAARGGSDDPPGDDSSRVRVSESAPSTTMPTTPAAGIDISGNCDELEHADDPACAAVVVPAPVPTTVVAPGAVDVSGPCDEPEHAADPRCTAGAVRGDDHGDDDHGDDDHGDDHGGDRGRDGDDDHGGDRGRDGGDD